MLAKVYRAGLLGSVAFGGLSVAATPAIAQDAALSSDIIVTARRTEERLQDVPISITVYNQEQLQQRNVAVASDLATYTPSLTVDQRFGPEKSAFAIRGFVQEGPTAPTVGVFFADVVGVRSSGGTTSGNTVGAGSFTDLQNVQVLKGPTGTLFGRNTTGGAVLLVPQKPTYNLEGYVEGTYGNFDQTRVQAAFNAPLSDTFRIRLATDINRRDGYMKNRAADGPDAYNDINYDYFRFSMVADLTPTLENYTIAFYSDSKTNGYASHYVACDRNAASPLTGGSLTRFATATAACDQIDRQNARGDDAYDVEVGALNPEIHLRTWQVINTTTWQASDTLTVKNIASYGEFAEDSAFNLYSDNFFVSDELAALSQFGVNVAPAGTPFGYIQLGKQPNYNASDQYSITEELQLQFQSMDGKFNGVLGGYLEFSRPLGWNQQRTGIYAECDDPGTIDCTTPLGFGLISQSRTKFAFDNHGIFAQGTYNFTDQLALTLGGRWTFDKIVGRGESVRYTLATVPGLGVVPARITCNDSLNYPNVNIAPLPFGDGSGDLGKCRTNITNKSNEPTWLINVDFKPTPDILLYAKYSRGYRQGGVNFTVPGIETWDPEKVDAYEIGAKTTFRGGKVNGYFNVAAFYNDFTDQQVFAQAIPKPEFAQLLAGGNAIINAGSTTLKGLEVDTSVTAFDIFTVSAGYTYLDTKIKELAIPQLAANAPFLDPVPRGQVGDSLALSPKHRLTLTGRVALPVPDTVGDISFGATYTYTAEQFNDTTLRNTPLEFVGRIAPSNLLNLNFDWKRVFDSPFDLAVFATNVTDEVVEVSNGGGYSTSGIADKLYGPPRMYGVRLKFNFGT
ncbi:TonB-dependent receptor [Novosphingobium sp. PC22D]|uniref:TonB-dependent receptor n=1 Tax=Novosphingobium sp. PC22D TaxID=1962403 RepID=UPI000BF0FAA2|nr:TonB-dependent receptor [Novosphingobium sp. PC22D]PEQ10392.1 TonB-dependent receptor [Novosphingobium sp. PC22D]